MSYNGIETTAPRAAEPLACYRGWHRISMARLMAFLTAALLYTCGTAADEAYLLIDSIVTPTNKKQPTWIALSGNRRAVHLPAGESILSIEPGRYWVEHIDFGENKHFGFGTVNWDPGPGLFSFTVFPDAITYVGIVELNMGQQRPYETDYTPRLRFVPELLEWACHKNPSAFSKLPVKYVNNEDEVKRSKCVVMHHKSNQRFS